jgi:hypothetical protein
MTKQEKEEAMIDHMGDLREEEPKAYTLNLKSHTDYPDLEDHTVADSLDEAIKYFKLQYPDMEQFITEKDIYINE